MEDLHQAFDRCPRKGNTESTGTDQDEPDESVIDYSVLEELVAMLGNDLEFASGLIEDFLEDGKDLLAHIKSAHDTGDASELERAAHTLKSSSATFGALDASRLCKIIEDRGNQSLLTGETLEKIHELEAMFSTVSQELKSYIDRQAV
jgi:HPt (histidine-containing phosphotransfer) domain-containing protein